MLTNEEKIKLIENKMNNLNFHIDSLVEGLSINPEETPGKPSRTEALESFRSQKQALEQLLTDLA